jgi:hypothetical protein
LIYGDGSAREIALATAHLHDCPGCAAQQEELVRARELLGATAVDCEAAAAPDWLRERVHRRLTAAALAASAPVAPPPVVPAASAAPVRHTSRETKLLVIASLSLFALMLGTAAMHLSGEGAALLAQLSAAWPAIQHLISVPLSWTWSPAAWGVANLLLGSLFGALASLFALPLLLREQHTFARHPTGESS